MARTGLTRTRTRTTTSWPRRQPPRPAGGAVKRLDVSVWHELVGRRRSALGRCRSLLELLPWYLWWYLAMVPMTEPNPQHPILWPHHHVKHKHALLVSAVASLGVVAMQLARWSCLSTTGCSCLSRARPAPLLRWLVATGGSQSGGGQQSE
eukprot:SAG22_NODE_3309_length_1788_cov_1.545293_2_plen_150_part_01